MNAAASAAAFEVQLRTRWRVGGTEPGSDARPRGMAVTSKPSQEGLDAQNPAYRLASHFSNNASSVRPEVSKGSRWPFDTSGRTESGVNQTRISRTSINRYRC